MISPIDHFTHFFGHQSLVFFFSNGEVDTLSTGKKNPWFVAFARNENVRESWSKAVTIGIFPMNHIKRKSISLLVITPVLPRSSPLVTILRLPMSNLMKSVILPISKSEWCHSPWWVDQSRGWCKHHGLKDSFYTHKNLSHFAQLALSLLRCNLMNSKVSLGVIDLMKILSYLVNTDDIHKTNSIGYISFDLAINLNKLLHVDLLYLISC